MTKGFLRYHGSKWRIAPWIISFFPKHRIYVEPFAGSAAVLLSKKPVEVEVYNDLDGELCNLFRVLRGTGAGELAKQIYLTPYSREDFIQSFEPHDDPVEQARRTLVRAYMGWGSSYCSYQPNGKSGKPENSFRIGWRIRGNLPNRLWNNLTTVIDEVTERLRCVVLENTDYKKVITENDTGETLIYCDPPYTASTRDAGGDYRYEFTDQDHVELAERLHRVQGMVFVSAYKSPLYDELYEGWTVHTKKNQSVGNTPRVEYLYTNVSDEQSLFRSFL